MGEESRIQDLAHGVPPIAVSHASTLANHTGSWKYIRPVYQDKVAPCNQGCPVGIDIEGYMNLLREGNTDAAIGLLLRENPLPATTGRVCYHPCESSCNRKFFDEAVSIHAVERVLGDMALEGAAVNRSAGRRREKAAIVGSGPAGLACAYYLARLGYGVTVFEAEAQPGGVLRYGIPEYRLPKDLLAKEIDRIRQLGVEFECGVRFGQDRPWKDLDAFDAVFVATGVHRSRSLGAEFEKVDCIRPGLLFLREVNRHLRPDIGRRVVVVGGGNTAIDCARTALRFGADVLVLYRRSREEMPANAEEVEDAILEGVKFEFLAAPLAPVVEERESGENPLDAIQSTFDPWPPEGCTTRLTGLKCQRMRLGEPDASGRRRPEPVAGSEFHLEADTILTALGEEPDDDAWPEKIGGREQVVPVDALGQTKRTTFFAGGDIIDEPHTVAFALGSGKRAALGIDRFLRARAGETVPGQDGLEPLRYGEKGNLSAIRWTGDDPITRHGAVNQAITFDELNMAHFRHVERIADRTLSAAEREGRFVEVNAGLTREDGMAEARRCFNCGVCNSCELCLIYCSDIAISRRDNGAGFTIDYEYCKGCGVCSEECPRGAVTMTREGL